MWIKEVLLTFADIGVATLDIFDGYRFYSRDIKSYQKWREDNKIDARRIYYLKNKGLLEVGKDAVTLTEKGRERLAFLALEGIKIPIPETWDNNWRLISFDVPEELKKEREAFTYRLKRLGFEPVNRSLYCFPFPCRNEILKMATFYKIERYITYFEATTISSQRNLLGIFKSKGLL